MAATAEESSNTTAQSESTPQVVEAVVAEKHDTDDLRSTSPLQYLFIYSGIAGFVLFFLIAALAGSMNRTDTASVTYCIGLALSLHPWSLQLITECPSHLLPEEHLESGYPAINQAALRKAYEAVRATDPLKNVYFFTSDASLVVCSEEKGWDIHKDVAYPVLTPTNDGKIKIQEYRRTPFGDRVLEEDDSLASNQYAEEASARLHAE